MNTAVETYNLADIQLLNNAFPQNHMIWQPDKQYLILGKSNTAEQALFMEKVLEDKLKVFKRPSGGQTVILSPKTLVIAVKLQIGEDINVHKYFPLINTQIIKALASLGVQHLSLKGISDIAIKDKKILGSSMYKKKDVLFYHAVLNLAEEVSMMEKYLKHPTKEPDYRKGRSHKDFVSSLKESGYDMEPLHLKKQLDTYFSAWDFFGKN